ncbi:MAG: MFS transporter, partial [Rhodothermales bacterium]|nr:MFS transporter [Rhodothermales bacterium]
EEPRVLESLDDDNSEAGSTDPTAAKPGFSFRELIVTTRPLWGFFIYSVYALAMRVGQWEAPGRWVEVVLGALTVYLIAEALFRKEAGKPRKEAGKIGFQKVLAAHSFTWLGIQTMFVYMFAYVQDTLPGLEDVSMGRVVSISFLVLNAVGAILPAFVLEPITERIGRVKTHTICIGIMTLGYAGILFAGTTPLMIYLFMAVLGVGWAATVSLPFAIMSQKVDQSKMGLYMGLFNLSVVLPQLVASLGVGEAIELAADKSLIFIICTLSLGLSTLAWTLVRENRDFLEADSA